MDFGFSDEQEAFRETLRRFCAERMAVADVRRWMETPEGFDRDVWKRMAEELGLQGVAVPEAFGGQGFGFLELGIVLEELGRELAGGPYLASLCAARAILHAGSDADRHTWLPRIATGDAVATLAAGEAGGAEGERGVRVEARRAGDGWRLAGEARLVLDGQNADLVVVPAHGREGLALFVVAGGAEGLAAAPCEGLDPTRKLADLRFDAVPARLLGEAGAGAPALARTLDEARVALCAEMVGGAARCLERAVEYAKVRVQFGRPIGSFQAIKHKAAEVLLELESARSAAYWAWWVADQAEAGSASGTPSLAEAASLAKACCADAYQRAAAECIQIHGGLGFTWEHDAHLYLRRARASDLLFGDASFQRARLAETLGL